MRPLSSNDPSRIGSYRLMAELGRGAMGRVLLGFGPDGRPAAVKLVREWLVGNEEFRARFRREVAASQQVSGAYTAAVLEAGPDDSEPWLASEYLFGPTLREAVETAGPLPESTVLRLAAGLASALAAIHRVGVIHRDLKPSNIILAADGPRVVDFGIAHATDRDRSDLTRTGGVVGTPEYMSPEQAQSLRLHPASDVFSLGAVLAMASTGVSPFADANTHQTLNNVVRAKPDLTGVPERVRVVAAACMAPDPAARPAPSEILALIGAVAPSARPWPDAVQALADRQRREFDRLLDGTGESTTLIDAGPTMVTDTVAPVTLAPVSGSPHRANIQPTARIEPARHPRKPARSADGGREFGFRVQSGTGSERQGPGMVVLLGMVGLFLAGTGIALLVSDGARDALAQREVDFVTVLPLALLLLLIGGGALAGILRPRGRPRRLVLNGEGLVVHLQKSRVGLSWDEIRRISVRNDLLLVHTRALSPEEMQRVNGFVVRTRNLSVLENLRDAKDPKVVVCDLDRIPFRRHQLLEAVEHYSGRKVHRS